MNIYLYFLILIKKLFYAIHFMQEILLYCQTISLHLLLLKKKKKAARNFIWKMIQQNKTILSI